MWYDTSNETGHYRVVTGYDQTGFFMHDPWDKKLWGGQYSGPNQFFDNALFEKLWIYHSNWVLILESGKPYDIATQPILDNETLIVVILIFTSVTIMVFLYRRKKKTRRIDFQYFVNF
jgi:hypothetical protein